MDSDVNPACARKAAIPSAGEQCANHVRACGGGRLSRRCVREMDRPAVLEAADQAVGLRRSL
eukprot:4438460-Pleurochrysis_carterae.AAC.1